MIRISKDTPCYYLTSVANHRLPVFQTDRVKKVTCEAIDEARKSSGLLLFAFVLMPDHIHLITDGNLKSSNVLRYINGITARRIIDYLKENNFTSSLDKLKQAEKERGYKYSLWQHHPNTFLITTEATFMQKVNYIHQNPVRANLVEKAEDYLYSSVRIWRNNSRDDEPLAIDIKEIDWRVR